MSHTARAQRPLDAAIRRVLQSRLTIVAIALALLTTAVEPAAAHGASAGDLPVVPEPVVLKHLRPADVVALFGRETLPESPGAGPRAARADSRDSLLPRGIEAVMRAGNTATVVLVGAENRFLEMQECLEVLDVSPEQVAPDRRRIVLTLRHADPPSVRSAVRRLAGKGSAVVSGRKLTLEGSAEWLHRALRQVIRGELGEPSTVERTAP
jgi:hypothetical protein